jgi:glycosyltransferase involved in cell wall biosynthesis
VIVGIDARAASEVPAGRGRVVRELLPALAKLDTPHRFRLYCRTPWDEVELGPAMEWVRVPLPDPFWHAATAVRASRGCEVFYSTNSYLTAWGLTIPSAVLVHDLIAFRTGAQPQRRAALIERATAGPAIRRAARLICNSHATEQDLLEVFPRARGKTAVVPLAAGSQFGASPPAEMVERAVRRHGLDGGFVLAAGTLEPRKNLARLIQAHGRLPHDLANGYPLLVVGPVGWEHGAVMTAAKGRERTVLFAGHVPDDELAALYASCTVFCYPSLYEGFGLPVLEAMHAGAPTITSNVSSLPEVAGDAAVYVDPLDEDAIRDRLEQLLTSPTEREELSERGRRRARDFSWERTATGTLKELERLVHAASA